MSKKPPEGETSGAASRRGAPRAVSGLERPVQLFRDLLTRLAAPGAGAIEGDDLFEELVQALSELLMGDNGGDPRARALRAAIYKEFESAASSALDPSALLIVGKIFSDAGWSVPESLKRRIVEALEDDEAGATEIGGDLEGTLAEIAEASEGDPFAAYDALNSVLAAFPSGPAGAMVASLAEGRAPVLRHVLAGFVMHRDPALAFAAIEALKGRARGERAESALVERLVRMRPWLPADRQQPLDETIRALRAHALAPVETERPQSARCFAMACDGSGAGGLLASLKARDGWRFVAAMTKPTGVEEAISVEGLGKREADAAVRGMRDSVTAAATDLSGFARCLELALGENVAAATPPPFRLVALAESLGLGPLAPRLISPADLLAEMLSNAPPRERDAEAVADARRASFDDALAQLWFESGEPVERLLAGVRGRKARARALLKDYLPQRRDFWVRACALTAFTLDLEPKAYVQTVRRLALIGRDLAEGVAMEEIGLMRDIAAVSVEAYESRA